MIKVIKLNRKKTKLKKKLISKLEKQKKSLENGKNVLY